MDLPLARCKPSPPHRVRHRIFPAPTFARSNDLRHFLPSTQSPRTRLSFSSEHAHRQKFSSVCIDKPSCNVLSTKEMSFHKKSLRFLEPVALTLREDHISWLLASTPARLPIKNHIIRQNIIALF